jgi:hypothetical protein
MIYEKVKGKMFQNQAQAFTLPRAELSCSLHKQELNNWMLPLTVCTSIAELKHKTAAKQ